MADSPLIDIQDTGEGGAATAAADDQLIGLEGPGSEDLKSAKEQARGGERGGEGGGGGGEGGEAGGGGEGGEGAGSAMEKHGGSEEKTKPKSTISWPWSKRDRLKRDPSLDKVDEDAEQGTAAERGTRRGSSSPLERCPDYFGVRSYLHHFYESRATFKDPDVYEEADDTHHLLSASSGRHRHCTAAWWKGFVFVGVLFLVVGIVCVLVGYLLPQKPILIGMVGTNKEVIDRQAIIYNYNLDACKLIGLILFCLGGLTLAVALMIPSFLYRHCDDERSEGPFAAPLGRDEAPPLLAKDPMLTAVPTTEKVMEVQPARKHDESALMREGMTTYPGLD